MLIFVQGGEPRRPSHRQQAKACRGHGLLTVQRGRLLLVQQLRTCFAAVYQPLEKLEIRAYSMAEYARWVAQSSDLASTAWQSLVHDHILNT